MRSALTFEHQQSSGVEKIRCDPGWHESLFKREFAVPGPPLPIGTFFNRLVESDARKGKNVSERVEQR
jgi:hypothetical protein